MVKLSKEKPDHLAKTAIFFAPSRCKEVIFLLALLMDLSSFGVVIQ